MSATSDHGSAHPAPAPAALRPSHGLARAAVITCSDSAADGVAVDTSGPLAAELLAGLGHEVTRVTVVPDEAGSIVGAVRAAIAAGARIVVTTGGTGAGPRDVTPEALRAAGLRELPGLGEAIRAASRERIPAADLSRTLGGILDGAVVLALPGSPGGVRDGLAAVGAAARARRPRGRGRRPRGPAPRRRRPGGRGSRFRRSRSTGSTTTTRELDPLGLVTATAISESEVAAEVARPAAGAVVTFAGVVRDHDRGRR